MTNDFTPETTPTLFAKSWEFARDDVRDLEKYLPNWDKDGADPVPLLLIEKTLSLFRTLETSAFPAPDAVYPSAGGTVFLEWHYASGAVQSINVLSDRIYLVFMSAEGAILSSLVVPDELQPHTASGDYPPADDEFYFSLAI